MPTDASVRLLLLDFFSVICTYIHIINQGGAESQTLVQSEIANKRKELRPNSGKPEKLQHQSIIINHKLKQYLNVTRVTTTMIRFPPETLL